MPTTEYTVLLRSVRQEGKPRLSSASQTKTRCQAPAGRRLATHIGRRLYHLKVGAAHARTRILAIVDEREVTVVALDTGEVLSSHLIEPAKGYWRNQRRNPGRWPRSQEFEV